MKPLLVKDIFKAAYIWQITGIEPEMHAEDYRQITSVFPETPEILAAVKGYLQGAPSPNAQGLTTRYKLLRNRIFSMRDAYALEHGGKP